MTAVSRYLILPVVLLVLSIQGKTQNSFASLADTSRKATGCTAPINRQLFHDYIDKEQSLILQSDGKNDNQFSPSANAEVNLLLTKSVVNRVDRIQCRIENDSLLGHSQKIRYLRGVDYLLKFYTSNRAAKRVNPLMLPDIIAAFEQCMEADIAGKSIEPIIQKLSYDLAYSVVNADRVTFENNPGFKKSRDLVILKYCILFPDKAFTTLMDYPDVPFADSLVKVFAKKYPRQLYDYAAAANKFGAVIRKIEDDVFVKTISRMAVSRSGQQYFPFLDNLVSGKMTIEEIDKVKDDSILYYRLLVNTQMEYVNRAINKDTAFEFKSLTKRLETKAQEVFVNTINALHFENDNIRYRIIQPLNAQELYYLAVSSDGLIYTSSFVKGVYPLMMKKINNRGDSLLMLLKFDKYRKFIKMSAGYNTLANFLSSFPRADDASSLMRAFVSNLEKSDGLEDGVDVADSYASIAESIKPLADEMLVNVDQNYERNRTTGNKRGMAIYNILGKLFLSADSANKIDLTSELGIPPVYEVPFNAMVNDSGRVIMQVFFYGDKDGQGIFGGFQNMFSNANWKIDRSNPYWITITSLKGKPVSIYANRPLPEETGEDEKAQAALGEYLENNKLYPSITIHRGHSYYAPYTIEQMFPTSKIVFLGSCGGYHLIHDVLSKAPDAHIIASKQIGRTAINRPFFQLLTEKARNGNGVEWIPFWKQFGQAANVDGFEDYIPPYKNLGALFIKAYKIAMEDEEDAKAF